MNSHTLQKDKELCRHSIYLMDEGRLGSWSSGIFSSHLCSDERTRNIIASLGTASLDRNAMASILNILETIE